MLKSKYVPLVMKIWAFDNEELQEKGRRVGENKGKAAI